MAGNPVQPGLLGQYGMDFTEEDLRKQDLLRRQRQTLELVNNIGFQAPAAQGAAQAGGMLAAALGNRNFKPDMEQQRKLAAVKLAQQNMELWQKANPEASNRDRAEKYQEFLASAAFTHGLPQIGSPMLQQLEDAKLARKRAEGELEELGLDVKYKKETVQSRIQKENIDAGKAGIIEFYPVGSRDPNASMTGHFDPATGSVTGADGKVYQVGQWKADRPQFDPRITAGLGSSRTGKILDKYGIGKEEAGGVRMQQMAVMQQIESMLEVDDLFNEALSSGRPINFTSDYGKLASLGERWTSFAGSLAEVVSPTGNVGNISVYNAKGQKWNIDDPGERARYAQENLESIKKLLPKKVQSDAAYSARYASLIVDMAYATARAAEPGAKALTQEDFKNAMVNIGGNLTNPDTLRKVMFTKAMQATKNMDFRMSQYPEEVQRVLVGDAAWENYNTRKGDLIGRWSHNPAEGATGSSYGKGVAGEPEFKIISAHPAGQ